MPNNKLMKAAYLLAVLVLLAGCGGGPREVPLEDRVSYVNGTSQGPLLPASRSESEAANTRPYNPEYEMVELESRMEANGRVIEFAELPTSQANILVCNAWLCEVTGEFWRWDYMCEQLLRKPAVATNPIDELIKSYDNNYGFSSIYVSYSSQLSLEQLVAATNTLDGAPLLQGYYEKSGTQDTYENYVQAFVDQGNRVVVFQAKVTYTSQSAQTEGSGEINLTYYYIVAPGADGNFVIINNTYYGSGKFVPDPRLV